MFVNISHGIVKSNDTFIVWYKPSCKGPDQMLSEMKIKMYCVILIQLI